MKICPKNEVLKIHKINAILGRVKLRKNFTKNNNDVENFPQLGGRNLSE